jgi:GT2 family glycosyltransferase
MLIRLLTGLLESDYKNIEIIIVNDNSTDDTLEVLKERFSKYKSIKIITNSKNMYTAGSRNKGASLAKGQYIFFIDDDNVVTKQLVSTLVAVMDSDENIGEVGPIMYYYHNKKRIFWAGTKRNMVTTKTNFLIDTELLPNGNTWETDDVLNAFMVRRNVITKNKITFIENLGIMYEESDYAQKIKNSGYKVLAVKDAIIFHDVEDPGKETWAFLQHTLKDKRRIYFTARNRLVFHSLYSSPWELIGIIFFWNWLFTAYYVFNIIRYQGKEKYPFSKKLNFILSYFHGVYDGICFNFTKQL